MAKKKLVVKKKFGGPQEGSGRPKKDISENMVYKLAQTLLTTKAIASILDCSTSTLEERFSRTLQRGRNNRRKSLVEAMWHKALEEKDGRMQIWLSKQHLEYKDTIPEQAQNIQFNVTCNEVPT